MNSLNIWRRSLTHSSRGWHWIFLLEGLRVLYLVNMFCRNKWWNDWHWERCGSLFQLFHDGGPYQIETSPLICRANERTGWFLYDRDLRHERVRSNITETWQLMGTPLASEIFYWVTSCPEPTKKTIKK